MTQQSISFKPDMIRAILDDRKTNTRRLKGLKEINKKPDRYRFVSLNDEGAQFLDLDNQLEIVVVKFPYGKPGETAWVRETWDKGWYGDKKDGEIVVYRADEELCGVKWKPSIHMPRWASRMDIQIINYKVERVQDISEEDAKAEGVTVPDRTVTMYDGIYRDAFFKLWDEISTDPQFNVKANPWVWAISPFKRVTQPQTVPPHPR